jgi:putative salt-induced outer membrane protein YdiY
MTVESLMNTFTEYATWLYSQREWARWELQTIAITTMVLLLFVLVHRRRAKASKTVAKQVVKKPSIIGIKLDAGKTAHKGTEGDTDSSRIVSVSKNNGNQMRWKETTKKWKNLQKLIEQLQEETAKYKQAEECLEQQFARLKAANEQLGQEIAGNGLVIEESELNRLRTVDGIDKKQSRILNRPGVLAENS